MSAREPTQEPVPLPRTWSEWHQLPMRLAGRGVAVPPARAWRRALLRGALFFVTAALLLVLFGGTGGGLGTPAELVSGLVALALLSALLGAVGWVELRAVGRPARLLPDLAVALATSLGGGLAVGAIALQIHYTQTLLRTGSLTDALALTYGALVAVPIEGVMLVVVGAEVAGALLLFRLGRPFAAALWANVSCAVAAVIVVLITFCDMPAALLEERWPAPLEEEDEAEPPA